MEFSIVTSNAATSQNVDDFVALVRAGEAVVERFVRQGIQRKGAKMVFARIDNEIVGVAALKVPATTYRNGIASKEKSGHSIPEDRYPYELGYVAVRANHGGKGLGHQLVAQVINLSYGRGLFATTSHPAMKNSILPRAGFKQTGRSWLNTRMQALQLFLRDV